MTALLKTKLVSETTGARIAQVSASLASFAILALGAFKLADLELTESQFLLGAGLLFMISLQCAIIAVLFDLKRKTG